jgi:hypothetical protein
MIIIQIFASLIINQFGELDESSNKRDEMIQGQCFVCGIKRATLEEKGTKEFEKHTEKLHSIWNYVYYIHLLKRTRNDRLSTIDQLVKSVVVQDEVSWLPFSEDATKGDDDD